MSISIKRGGRAIFLFVVVPWIVGACAASAVEGPTSTRLNHWRFTNGDPAEAATPRFDDSTWQKVRVPHDWAIAGPFNARHRDGSTGKLPWKGTGWYRTEFTLDRREGSRVYLDFDGVMAFPQVYVNGQLVGDWDYGYTSFRVDATDQVNLNGKNVVAVRVDTTKHGSRWYPGAGIYRKVLLEVREPVHLAHWGIFVTTPEVTDGSATVNVKALVDNHAADPVAGRIIYTLIDPTGKDLTTSNLKGDFTPGESQHQKTFQLLKPQHWDVAHPHLYSLKTELEVDGRIVDSQTTPFGIRTFEFTADDGFHLNGRRVQLYGVNLHHDHGPLGAVFNTRAMERQLEIMKEMGVNALRTSHNAPAPEVLELCDRMGIIVWDECFDKWNTTADRFRGEPSHQEHGERHLKSMVLRDRNHPSVVLWSIGNEIPDDREGVNADRVKMLGDIVRKYDSTRPVTLGSCFPDHVAKGHYKSLDVVGWNYLRRYGAHRDLMPEIPIVYSESASALSTRGFYNPELATNKTDYAPGFFVCSYDLNSAAWSDIPDAEFRLMKNDPFVAGEFVWTGFDYIGEPTPYTQDARSSYFGIVDLAGIPKDRYWLYRSYWRPDETTVHILPHWNWPEHVGQNVPVFVYTNGDSAELFLNGKSLGRRTKGAAPSRPENLAANKPVSTSSTQPGNDPASINDGDLTSRWCAESDAPVQWFEIDLEKTQPVKCLVLEFEKEAKNYGYVIKTSLDGENWEVAATHNASGEPQWGGPSTAIHHVDNEARYVRIEFEELRNRAWASIWELAVYTQPAESSYYDPTYDYRLRWNDVTYEPGELKVVAYKGAQEIGTATIKTAGEPAQLRLTPDRTKLTASGDDLCYVTVEALDKGGNLCPLAENRVNFQIAGPAEIAGVCNGDPISLDSFQADHGKLFFGKTMLVVRTQEGRAGEIKITAIADGLEDASIAVGAQ
jgi:beta-galactosidase